MTEYAPIELVEVVVTATEKLRHRQTRRIAKSIYDRYLAMIEDGGHRGSEFDTMFGDLLHPDIDADSDGIEDVEIELAAKPKRKKK